MEQAKSIEDRVADQILGDEPEEAPEAEAEPVKATSEEETDEGEGDAAPDADESEKEPLEASEPEVFEYQIGDNVYEVPKDIKEELEKARDYTQKTQTLSSERKQFEIVRTQLEQSQKQYEFANSIQKEAAELQTLEWQITQANQYIRENVDNLTDKDLLKLRYQIDEAKTQKDAITQSLQAKFGEFQQAQEQAAKELLDKSTEVLRSKVQNWDRVKDEVIKFVKDQGFTDHDVQIALTDPRQIQLAHDAMKYRQLKATTTAAVKKVESAPIKPKSRDPMPDHVKTQLNLRKQRKATKDPRKRERLIQEEVASMFD